MALEWGSTELAAVIPEQWSKDVLAAVYSDNGIMKSILLTPTDKGRADIVHIAVAPRFSTNAVGSDGSITLQQLTTTDNTVTMNVWREVSVQVIDRDSWQSVYGGYEGLIAQYKEGFIDRLKEYVELDILSLWSSITTNVVNDTGDTGAFNLALMRAGMQKLDESRVPKKDRTLVLSPEAFTRGILGDTQLSSAAVVGGQSLLRDGSTAMPVVYGVKVISSQEVATSGGLAKNLLIQKETIALAISRTFKFLRLDKVDYTETFSADVLYGRGVIRETFGAVINSRVGS